MEKKKQKKVQYPHGYTVSLQGPKHVSIVQRTEKKEVKNGFLTLSYGRTHSLREMIIYCLPTMSKQE